MSMHVRVGTRGSRLALYQADEVAARLRSLGFSVERVVIRTRGDRNQRVPLFGMGEKGVFVKELERALQKGEIDLAVHSAKDVPTELDDDFELVAALPRGPVWDVLVSPYSSLDDLPTGARVGTSSIRRAAMIRRKRPDLACIPIRGNVDTRLKKVHRGDVDALILAQAGLERLGFVQWNPDGHTGRVTVPDTGVTLKAQILRLPDFVPAAAQGIIVVETRRDHPLREAFMAMDDAITSGSLAIERRIILGLGGGCHAPVGVYSRSAGENRGEYEVSILVLTPDGSESLAYQCQGRFPEVAERVIQFLEASSQYQRIREQWRDH